LTPLFTLPPFDTPTCQMRSRVVMREKISFALAYVVMLCHIARVFFCHLRLKRKRQFEREMKSSPILVIARVNPRRENKEKKRRFEGPSLLSVRQSTVAFICQSTVAFPFCCWYDTLIFVFLTEKSFVSVFLLLV